MNWPNSANLPIVSTFKAWKLSEGLKFENLRRFEQFAILRHLKNQQFFDAMNGHHFEKAEKRSKLN